MTRKELLQEIMSAQIETKHAMFSHFQHAFADTGLSPAPLQLLLTMMRCDKVSSKNLAGKLHLTPGAISQLVDGLEQSGFISREQDAKDRRVTYLSLSDSGKQKMRGLQEKRDHMVAEALTSLSDDDLKTFLKVQKKMLEYFKTKDTECDDIKKKEEN
jgi:DNA-binding MarR family transcriptional regulator